MTFAKKLGSLIVLGAASLMAAGWFQPSSTRSPPAESAIEPSVTQNVEPSADPSADPNAWCEIEGVVFTPNGKPFAHATLYAEHDGSVSGSGETDAQGRYRIRSGNCDLEINVLIEGEVVFQQYLMLQPGSHRTLNPRTSRPGAWQSIF